MRTLEIELEIQLPDLPTFCYYFFALKLFLLAWDKGSGCVNGKSASHTHKVLNSRKGGMRAATLAWTKSTTFENCIVYKVYKNKSQWWQ